MTRRYAGLTPIIVGATDFLAAGAAWTVGYLLRDLAGRWGLTPHPMPPAANLAMPAAFSLVLAGIVFSRSGLYGSKRTASLLAECGQLAQAVLIAWAATYVVMNMSREVPLSRVLMIAVLAAWLVLGIGSRLAGRAVLHRLRRGGRNLRTAAIVGTGRLAQKVHQRLQQNRWVGIRTLYFVDDVRIGERIDGREVVGPLDRVDELVIDRPVDIVFVALKRRRHEDVGRVLDGLPATGLDVRWVPDLMSFYLLEPDVSVLEDLPVISLTHSRQGGANALLKRGMDLMGAGIGLALLSIPMLVIAAVIRLTSGGPVLYRQERMGLGGERFSIIKFRTMRPDAEDKTGPVWASDEDARVTPAGRLLRKTSLDELPQLLNVLAGQMSLVGPRPERPELIERFRRQLPRYMMRHRVKAGLTGWAQAHGFRGGTSLRKRIQYDLYYIRNWSIGLDVRIILMTAFGGFLSRRSR